MDGINHGFRYWDCDDGNTNSGDGCSSLGLLEPGWKCTDDQNYKSHCSLIEDSLCGNGKREGKEECDDGNYFNKDNCTMFCM